MSSISWPSRKKRFERDFSNCSAKCVKNLNIFICRRQREMKWGNPRKSEMSNRYFRGDSPVFGATFIYNEANSRVIFWYIIFFILYKIYKIS